MILILAIVQLQILTSDPDQFSVCHSVCEFVSTIWIKWSDVLKIWKGCDILIYTALITSFDCFGTLIVLGPAVQSVISLKSLLRVIWLTVLVESLYNILIFFAEKMWVAFAL